MVAPLEPAPTETLGPAPDQAQDDDDKDPSNFEWESPRLSSFPLPLLLLTSVVAAAVAVASAAARPSLEDMETLTADIMDTWAETEQAYRKIVKSKDPEEMNRLVHQVADLLNKQKADSTELTDFFLKMLNADSGDSDGVPSDAESCNLKDCWGAGRETAE
eukprot:9158494-Pyramimonas_sp.AAC.1